ncbi:MAG: hypothetical protein CMN05_08590 [Roseibacillus sp.]|nr:hypothetical protein [Roseibacillus sp.]MBP35614.1 hypothetical protein [Roseibacillus sp.]
MVRIPQSTMKSLLYATTILATPLIAAPVPLLKTAATVNGKMISTREVQQQIAPTIAMLMAKYPRRGEQFQKAITEARREVLDQLIEHKLVLSKLEEKQLQIPDHIVKQEVERFIRINFKGDQEDFRKYLKAIRMTRREFEKSQQEKILIQAFKREQFKDVAPATDAEIRKRFNERAGDLRDRTKDRITFRKIYIPAIDQNNPIATQEDQLALAEKLAVQVKGEADFSSVAQTHSSGAFADKGGLWEDTLRSDLEVGFADIIFDASEGAILGPLKDRIGFTIVKIVKVNQGPLPALDTEMRERMRTEVEIEKRSGRYAEWIKMLKRTAIIRRNA